MTATWIRISRTLAILDELHLHRDLALYSTLADAVDNRGGVASRDPDSTPDTLPLAREKKLCVQRGPGG